jgi:hypothetical protein
MIKDIIIYSICDRDCIAGGGMPGSALVQWLRLERVKGQAVLKLNIQQDCGKVIYYSDNKSRITNTEIVELDDITRDMLGMTEVS